ncbi:hypothetical protein BU16DRAFT_557467 [Lophium mytilinum]|uniref:Uncharacterized protein n=1 Tax=Lophium mytilinum TaxID=390894 RepID=A0A6A6R5C6_9PEZI|nr:hypothetical protein BU16DRAFT_557467 [Lophium mytilinum]
MEKRTGEPNVMKSSSESPSPNQALYNFHRFPSAIHSEPKSGAGLTPVAVASSPFFSCPPSSPRLEHRIHVDLDQEEGRANVKKGKENRHKIYVRFTKNVDFSGLQAFFARRRDISRSSRGRTASRMRSK